VKLLFDENLSARLVALLQTEYPGSAHVEQLLGRGRSDGEVWEYARKRLCDHLERQRLSSAGVGDQARNHLSSRVPLPAANAPNRS